MKFANIAVEEKIPFGSHLLVNAHGWLLHILDRPNVMAMQRQSGGSYFELDELITEMFFDLLDYGLIVSMYFDGEDSQMKKATKNERNQRDANSWTTIYKSTVGENLNLMPFILEIMPLLRDQFICTLKSLGINMIQCDYEADKAITNACIDAQQNHLLSYYCYSYNS